MDDGFQNPTIKKDFSIIVINASQEFGNKRVIPSGPLRESIKRGLSRTNLVVVIGEASNFLKKIIPDHIPIFPLSGVIYFPKTNLPLNIFEQRYLDLVNDAIQKDKLMG